MRRSCEMRSGVRLTFPWREKITTRRACQCVSHHARAHIPQYATPCRCSALLHHTHPSVSDTHVSDTHNRTHRAPQASQTGQQTVSRRSIQSRGIFSRVKLQHLVSKVLEIDHVPGIGRECHRPQMASGCPSDDGNTVDLSSTEKDYQRGYREKGEKERERHTNREREREDREVCRTHRLRHLACFSDRHVLCGTQPSY